jgi:allophanate hydrolase
MPPKPGLLRVSEGGVSVEVEVWRMPTAALGGFVALIPPPLCIGRVMLDTGGLPVLVFLCEAAAVSTAEDISYFGSWRAYLQHSRGAQASVLH